MKLVSSLALATPLVLAAPMAWAIVDFTGEFSLDGESFEDPGLVVEADPMSGPLDFSLEEGESQTFDLFSIWTDEEWVHSDDVQPQDITASFEFYSPLTSGEINGETVGYSFYGIYQDGSIEWGETLELSFGDGGLLEIELSDEVFNWGYFGLSEGEHYGATVEATVTLIQEPSSVPLPASGLLLLGAVAGIGVASRRRRRA